MIDDETSALLQRAQDLLGQRDVPAVLKRALGLLVSQLEKRKFAVTDRPRRTSKGSDDPDSVPAHVRRAVYLRDGGRCTYVCPETGKRCASCRRLEYDHIIPRARGGKSTKENLRLRCRAHNQLAAEQEFGRAFMQRKRNESDDPAHRDLVSGLRGLGYRVAESKEAADLAMRTEGSLESRMRAALTFFQRKRAMVAATRTERPPGPAREEATTGTDRAPALEAFA
jgi:5-methylcytosine-specific restriction endonuclease McrA